MVSILEVYKLTCTLCRKPKMVRRLHVYGNLAEIESTYVCPACEDQPPAPPAAEPSDAGAAPAAGGE